MFSTSNITVTGTLLFIWLLYVTVSVFWRQGVFRRLSHDMRGWWSFFLIVVFVVSGWLLLILLVFAGIRAHIFPPQQNVDVLADIHLARCLVSAVRFVGSVAGISSLLVVFTFRDTLLLRVAQAELTDACGDLPE